MKIRKAVLLLACAVSWGIAVWFAGRLWAAYVILQQISFKNQKFEIHELIDISATMLPPMFIAFVAEMFLGDGSLKLLPVHGIVLLCYGIFVYVFLIGDFTRKAKVYYLACYVGIFCLSRVLL